MTEEAYIEAYNSHSDAIFRHCLFRVRDRELAQDLMQQTFMKVWKHITKGKEVTELKAFLYKVATNLIIDHSRKKKSRSLDALLDQGFDPGEDKETDLKNQLDARSTLSILDELKPPSYQEIILLRYAEDLSIQDIATHLKMKENNVSVRLNRALKKMRQLLLTSTPKS